MKQFFRDYFTFNKRERNGVFILLSIICVLILYLNISSHFIDSDPVDFTDFERDIAEFNASLNISKDSAEEGEPEIAKAASNETESPAERFDFDPNGLAEEKWKRLGLTAKQIRSIRNYESKGGTFRKKEDVKKMYCIKEALYYSLEPYIKIPQDQKPAAVFIEKSIMNTEKASFELLELNSADSASLISIKGIGPFFAKAIIKYRNSLGGFVSKEQLLEVWKFDREKFDAIEKYIRVDASKVKKININTCEAIDLKSGYIKWNLANAIVNYRNNHGKYKTLEEIRKTDLVDDETYRKIVPYLVIE